MAGWVVAIPRRQNMEPKMIKLGRVSEKTRGTPVIPFWVEDRIDYQPGNKEPLV